MPKLLDTTALGQSIQASKTYTDERISDVELSVQQATEKEVQDVLDDVFGNKSSIINYVTFDSDEPRTITPTYTNTSVTLQYSLDTETWIDIASKEITPSAKTIYFRGQATGTKSLFDYTADSNKWIFSGDALNKLRVIGNLNYLLCDTLGDAIPPIALGDYCYARMFLGCTTLVVAPELPATTLAFYCYGGMFRDCTSLIVAPELPAMTMAENCYRGMFQVCTSLVNAPELPATTLAGGCYYNMFWRCASLTTAPELPATTLVDSCYCTMFDNCSVLSFMKIHATDNLLASDALKNMLNKISSSGALTCKEALTTALLATPTGWARVNF